MQVYFAYEYFSVSKKKDNHARLFFTGRTPRSLTYGYNDDLPILILNLDFIINQFNELLELL